MQQNFRVCNYTTFDLACTARHRTEEEHEIHKKSKT